MSGDLWISRARLRRDSGAVGALARLLVPQDGAARTAAGHHLVWSLFADSPEQKRDFLWREEEPGKFITLSARRPDEAQGLFAVESKPFAPALAVGDKLIFALRANPVVTRGGSKAEGRRGKRHDVVMDALYHHPKSERAPHRLGAVAEAGRAWLASQADRHGFGLTEVLSCDGYDQERLPRPGKEKPLVFGRIDFTGVLTVVDPLAFTAALAGGFGHAKAFGCGLMLIRRG